MMEKILLLLRSWNCWESMVNHCHASIGKMVYADSEETEEANNIATNVFDLQESTFWHTSYSSAVQQKFPHQIVINLGEDKVITGFSYLPRAEANKTGMIKDYRIYLKMKPFKI